MRSFQVFIHLLDNLVLLVLVFDLLLLEKKHLSSPRMLFGFVLILAATLDKS